MTDVDQLELPEGTPEGNEDLNDDVVSRLEKAMDSRFSGFQGVLDKNISTLRNEFASQLEEVKRSNLSPEERENLETAQERAEVEKLRRENELLRLRKDYPDEVDFLDSWLEKENFVDQLALLSEFRKRTEAGTTPREDPETDESTLSPVDLNNPKRPSSRDDLASLVRNQGSMTREAAQKLLEATNERGIMARLRRQS